MNEVTQQVSWNQCKIKNHPLKLTNKHHVFNAIPGTMEAPFYKRNYNNFMTSVAATRKGSPGQQKIRYNLQPSMKQKYEY